MKGRSYEDAYTFLALELDTSLVGILFKPRYRFFLLLGDRELGLGFSNESLNMSEGDDANDLSLNLTLAGFDDFRFELNWCLSSRTMASSAASSFAFHSFITFGKRNNTCSGCHVL